MAAAAGRHCRSTMLRPTFASDPFGDRDPFDDRDRFDDRDPFGDRHRLRRYVCLSMRE